MKSAKKHTLSLILIISNIRIIKYYMIIKKRIKFQTYTTRKKRIRIGFIKHLAPDIQPVLKVSGAKCFITGAKIIS